MLLPEARMATLPCPSLAPVYQKDDSQFVARVPSAGAKGGSVTPRRFAGTVLGYALAECYSLAFPQDFLNVLSYLFVGFIFHVNQHLFAVVCQERFAVLG